MCPGTASLEGIRPALLETVDENRYLNLARWNFETGKDTLVILHWAWLFVGFSLVGVCSSSLEQNSARRGHG